MSNTVLLKDIADIITGPFGSQLHESDYVPEGVPSIMPQNIGNRILNYDGIARITEKDAKRLSRYLVKENDIVYARRGDVEKHAFITAQDEGAICGTGCLRVRITSNAVYPTYLSHFLNRPETRRWITLHAVGSNMPNINTDILGAVPIELPAYETQKAIADMLSDFDKKINLNTHLCAELEAMAKTLYDYWFVQFDFPDENGKPYRTSGGAMEWCQELGREVPKGWRAIDILTLCDVVDCLHSKKPEYFFEYEDSYMLTLENLTKEGYIDLSEKFYISKSDYDEWVSRIEVQENDFVVTNAGRAGDIGKIPHGVKCAIGRNLTAIRPKGISAYYLREYFKSDFVKQQILSNLDSGSFFMSFNVKSIKKMMILIPDSRTLASYLQLAKPIIQRIESIIAESQQLTILRDWLLPMLMNGQVRVADTPSESRRTVFPKPSTDDQAFEQWMVSQGLAARGDADMETYRNIFDAMDEDDK